MSVRFHKILISRRKQKLTECPATNSGVLADIQKVYNKWDKNSSDCEFKHYFYNQYPPEIASTIQKPDGDDQKAWDKAYAERPNSGAVPVLAYGFAELSQRVRAQDEQIAKYRIVLHSIHDTLNKIQQRHELINSLKLDHCRRRHVELARRALSLAAKVQVLKNRGYALQPDEEVLKKRLETLSKDVGDPGIWGRLNEIWARMTVVRERAKKMEEEVGTGPVEWDEAQLKTTQKVHIPYLLPVKPMLIVAASHEQFCWPPAPRQGSPGD